MEVTKNVSFESIVAGVDFTCGLTTKNLSILCWGPWWGRDYVKSLVPLPMTIPGPCVQSSCNRCGVYPNSEALCGRVGNICRISQVELPVPALVPPIPPPEVRSQGGGKKY